MATDGRWPFQPDVWPQKDDRTGTDAVARLITATNTRYPANKFGKWGGFG